MTAAMFDALTRARRSTRQFLPAPVPEQLLQALIETACRAPSAHNARPWRFTLLTDSATLRALAKAMSVDFRRDLERDGLPPDVVTARVAHSLALIGNAPAGVLLNLTLNDMNTYADPQRAAAERDLTVQSAALAGGQLLLAATAHGLGSVWLCAPRFCQATVAQHLALPADWEPQALILLGYPADDAHDKPPATNQQRQDPINRQRPNVVALAGGVGGARLAQGLAHILPPEQLSIIVNTGDDFEHWGLTICPDLDTVMYTLADVANPETGWGLAGESFNCMEAMTRLDAPDWFRLGDRDLATHLTRTQGLHAGLRLTEVTAHLAQALGVAHPLLPMSDDPCRTIVLTEAGELPFQDYFVRLRWQPAVQGFRWAGGATVRPTPEVLSALEQADLIILCPSNPFVSLDPILNLPGVRAAVAARPTVAVSPILGGAAIKGPAAKMFRELGKQPSAVAVAEHYRGLLSGFVLDTVDAVLAPTVAALGMQVCVTPTLMPGLPERVRVAHEVLAFGATLL